MILWFIIVHIPTTHSQSSQSILSKPLTTLKLNRYENVLCMSSGISTSIFKTFNTTYSFLEIHNSQMQFSSDVSNAYVLYKRFPKAYRIYGLSNEEEMFGTGFSELDFSIKELSVLLKSNWKLPPPVYLFSMYRLREPFCMQRLSIETHQPFETAKIRNRFTSPSAAICEK